MNTSMRILIAAALAVAVIGAVALNQRKAPVAARSPDPARAADAPPAVVAGLPRLVDLGADTCIPCKMMVPVLADLKNEYAGKLNVQFIDVWKNPEAGKSYGLQLIPTQIFFNAAGKELFRHVGFFGKEDILAKWNELGVDLSRGE